MSYNNNVIILCRTSDIVWSLIYFIDNIMIKSKSYQMSPKNRKLNVEIQKIARRDFKIWKALLYKYGFLENDDFQLFNQKYLTKK